MKKIFLIILMLPFLALAQTQTENYIKTTTYKGAGATLPVVQVSYYDGLGRPIQQVAHAQSNTGKDIVTHIEYDAFGRQVKDFLPYVNGAPSLNYNTSANTEVGTFYNNPNYENTLNPFSQKEFEASPLNRVQQQAAPGNDWGLAIPAGSTANHTIKLDYQTNTATEVKLYSATATWQATSGKYEIALTSGTTNYDANQLYKTITKDENWTAGNNNTTEEFKNKEGQVVLKRTYNATVAHDTYYVYDMYGNLSYVIPPKANGAIDTATLNNLCYQYKYDYRNRLVEKKLPGKQLEFIVYDKLDRPVATGPAFSPFSNATANTVGWLITKYDAFSRPVYTGWQQAIVNEIERKNIQNDQNNLTTTLNETKLTSGNINGIDAYYSNAVEPTTFKLLTVNYYDDYNFPIAPPISYADVEGQPVYYNNTLKPKGMPTGSWVRTLGTDTAIIGETAYTLYDYKARTIRSFTTNHLGGYTQVDSKLDFIGKAEFTKTRHKYNASSTELLVTENFTYSAHDRLLTHTHQINSMPAQLLADNSYDELGQLISKKVGNTTSLPLQKVDYNYNIRGWLKGINDDPTSNLVLNTSEKDLFAFKLNYNTVQNLSGYLGKPLFNGNIAETHWRTSSDNVLRKYGYFYDDLNRLLNSVYQRPNNTVPVTNSYNENIAYDKNGNITTLVRNGDFDSPDLSLQIDYLDYQYKENNSSNRLAKVTDLSGSNASLGFKNGTNTDDDYAYDDNGNMTLDKNKLITLIKYNHLNLPTEILFTATKKINYIYNATGMKLQKIVTNGASVKTTDYLSGFQYENTVLKYFPHAEGYVNFDANVYKYVFNYTDHLGNIRLSYTKDDTTNLPVIMEENHYYPFGLKHTNYNTTVLKLRGNSAQQTLSGIYKYRYGGKEYQDELGLNMYDFGSRNYDASLGRWMNIDPQAEKYYSYSSYNYTLNSPMYYVDPNGEDIYLHYFLRNNHHGDKKDRGADKMFWAAAMTRAVDFLNSGEGGSDDIMIMKGIDSMDDIEANVESDIAENKDTYGKTAEFGLWSHSGIDGPFREDGKGNYDQLSVKDWGKIDFNWSKGANAMFYGCRSGFDKGEWSEAGNKKSFVEQLSSMSNMQDVKVWGQTQRSWPSPFTDTRVYTENIGAGKHGYPTYMVGSKIGITSFNTVYLRQPTYGFPMSIYQNGKLTGYSHQPGTKR